MPAVLEAGLPNLKGYYDIRKINASVTVGDPDEKLFSRETSTEIWDTLAFSPGKPVALERIRFDASKHNTIYGQSSTVQPPSITLIPQLRYQDDGRRLHSV